VLRWLQLVRVDQETRLYRLYLEPLQVLETLEVLMAQLVLQTLDLQEDLLVPRDLADLVTQLFQRRLSAQVDPLFLQVQGFQVDQRPQLALVLPHLPYLPRYH